MFSTVRLSVLGHWLPVGWIRFWRRVCDAVDGRLRGMGRLVTLHRATHLNNKRGEVRSRRGGNGCATHRHVTVLLSRKDFRRFSVFMRRHYAGFNVRGAGCLNSNVMANCKAVSKHLMCVCTRSFAIFNNTLSRTLTVGVYGMVSRTVGVNTPIVNLGSSNNTHVRRNIGTLTNCTRVFRHGVLTSKIVPRVSNVFNPYTNNTICSPTLASFGVVAHKADCVFLANPGIMGAIANRSIARRRLNNTDMRAAGSNITRFTISARRSNLRLVHGLVDFLPRGGLRRAPLVRYGSPVSHLSSGLGSVVPSGPGRTCSVCRIVKAVVSGNRFLRMRTSCTGGVVINFTHFGNRAINVMTGRPGMVTNYLSDGTSHGTNHFIHFYSTFGVPLIALISMPKFLPNANRRCGNIVLRKTGLLCTCNRTAIPGMAMALHGSCNKTCYIVDSGRLHNSVGCT